MDCLASGIDRDLNLKESSGLVNPLGLKETSTYAALKTRKDSTSDGSQKNDENFDDPKPLQTLPTKTGSASTG